MATRAPWLVLSALGVLLVPSPARAAAIAPDAAIDNDASVIVIDDAGIDDAGPPPPVDAGPPPPVDAGPPPPVDAGPPPPDDAAAPPDAPDADSLGVDAGAPTSELDATATDPATAAVDASQGGVTGVTPFSPSVQPFDPSTADDNSCSASAGRATELPSPFVLGLVASLFLAFRLRRRRR